MPAEITDTIIDHLHDNRRALKACSLVRRDWKPAARLHLFNSMSAAPEKCSFNQTVAFLVSKVDISPHIEHFSLSGYRGISFADLEALLKTLPNLRTLTISGVYISKSLSDPEVTTASAPSTPASLDTLRIKECNVIEEGVDTFFPLLGLFSRIDHLYISTWRGSGLVRSSRDLDDLEDRMGLIFPPHVQILNLTIGSLPMKFLAQLCHPWSLPFWESIHNIDLQGVAASWAEIKQLGNLFSSHGSQLRRVSIKASPSLVQPEGHVRTVRPLGLGVYLNTDLPPVPAQIRDTKKDWKALRLKECAALEAFTLILDHKSDDDHRVGRETFSIAVDLLTHLPSHVRQVRIDMIPRFNGERMDPLIFDTRPFESPPAKLLFEDLDWQTLDKVLSAPRFDNLTVILEVVRLKDTFTRRRCWAVVDNIRDYLPLLSSRNMLAFAVRDE
ncbi:hypothetical protein K466DRAFT_663164 [Polyporus arcularius HHB13444]|uniref:F-box domain-containing protein n=1 Tax=Polyporus arcularius HHB13444 TaxID=1314778 RepID=A0A5C3PDE3_9APHY|nr:hypothetical protein K466DRAFT_663164 [Polyporus arcularius HHB13444]